MQVTDKMVDAAVAKLNERTDIIITEKIVRELLQAAINEHNAVSPGEKQITTGPSYNFGCDHDYKPTSRGFTCVKCAHFHP